MKVNSILDLGGAFILLAAISLVIAKPQVIATTGQAFGNVLKIARG